MQVDELKRACRDYVNMWYETSSFAGSVHEQSFS